MAADSRGTGPADAGVLRGLAQLYRALTHSRRRQLFLVLALMIAGAVAELATIGAVLPFLTFLARPGSLGDSALFQFMKKALGRELVPLREGILKTAEYARKVLDEGKFSSFSVAS